MPQREFWTQRHPVRVQWTYDVDPLRPQGSATLLVAVVDQAGEAMERRSVKVPDGVLDECVPDLVARTWFAYLHGEANDVELALTAGAAAWRLEEVRRSRQG